MTEKIFLCPSCGGAALDIPELMEQTAVCAACGWQGPRSNLLSRQVAGQESVDGRVSRMFGELSKAITDGAAKGIAEVLCGWGLLPRVVVDETKAKVDTKVLNAYLYGMCRAALKSVFETTKTLEVERVKREQRTT